MGDKRKIILMSEGKDHIWHFEDLALTNFP